MIGIISENNDLVTDLVVEWLIARGRSFKRFNDSDFVNAKARNATTMEEIYQFEAIEKIWHRRGTLNFLPDHIFMNYPNRLDYIKYLSKEVKILNDYYEYKLRQQLKDNYIGSLKKETENNKLVNLAIAKKHGLNIPNSLITTNKKDLQDFYDQYAPLISKDLRAPVMIHTRNKNIVSIGVKLLSQEDIDLMEDIFAPVFLQQYIEKQYEIRAFIACGEIYPMAIFSQNDNQTKVDFRNYNKVKPNRCVPVKLPETIEMKVWDFMKEVDMNTGSIDIILTPAGDYYFLEVNPMGQFHWLSQNCNYQIEREIAKFLCDEKN